MVKLDELLVQLLSYLDQLGEDATILDEVLLIFQNKVLPIKTTKTIQLIVFYLAEKSKSRASSFISFLLSNIFENQQQQNWYRIFAQSNFYLFSYLLRSTTVTPKVLQKTFLFLIERLHKSLALLEPAEIDQQVELIRLLQDREVPLLILQSIIMVKLGNQTLDRPDINEIFKNLLEECGKKLHFEFFLKQ